MAPASANTVVDRAMVKARIIRPGEAGLAAIRTQVYNELLYMLEKWSLEKLMLVADVMADLLKSLVFHAPNFARMMKNARVRIPPVIRVSSASGSHNSAIATSNWVCIGKSPAPGPRRRCWIRCINPPLDN